MRTTLTLDDDVAAALDKLRRSGDKTHKQLVNEASRMGFRQLTLPPATRAPYRTPTVALGKYLIGSLDGVSEVLAVAGGLLNARALRVRCPRTQNRQPRTGA